ncbi:uncharacterized protein LOC122923640 isoform X2 [Bufo gargarizans]|uniref:uncharacterized protein LOC122923640 isoform X2 n=1 Tax=Bufo gargarizans TaxID=30331 RepID=UPI001CF3F77D|nr:uncharacterized protein LOC122923640 isoform X2 [Bufo gargarizans]
MEASTRSGTIGELLLALYEMGFDESQVQAALRAGCFRVQDAAEWILQGGQPRGTLLAQQAAEPGAVAAFNPPLEGGGEISQESSSSGSPSSPELQPLPSSRRMEQRREYEERHSASLAREVMEEKRTKKKDRDLVLRRIAEDRQMQQDKDKMASAVGEQQETQGHLTARPAAHNHCALMVRLPSGQSVRLGLPGDSRLQSVCDHVHALQPALAPCRLLQTFPTRHFTEQDLPRSLQELGLTPNATLCVHPGNPPTGNPPTPEPPESSLQPPMCKTDELMMQGERLRPILRSPAQAVAHDVHMRTEPALQHCWGRGHRLVPEEESGAEEEEEGGASVQDDGVSAESHQWPMNGVRLRLSHDDGSSLHPPRVMARAAAEMRQESVERPEPPRISRTSAVSTLRSLTLRRAMPVITAPSMQYPGSLSGLTPDLAEMIIDYMIKEQLLRPRTLELFAGCPVGRITLSCYPYCTNDLIRQLRGFPGLRRLSLSSSGLITDQGLSVVQQLQKLQHLNLSACRNLTESCLLHLRGLKHLSHLVLDQTKVSDGGMCDFLLNTDCSLTHLSVNQTAITERTLGILVQRSPELRVLSVKHTQVSDISPLCGLKHLTTLHLDSTRVTEESLQAVSSLPALSTLTLSGVQSLSSNRVLELLSGLSLTRLLLPGRHSLSDVGLSHLSRLCGLLELDLTDHTQITDHGVQHISQLTRLRVLSLCNTSVSDSGLRHLQGLKLLEELSLDRTKVTSRGVSQCIPHLPHLQVLGLADTGVGDNVLKLGVQNCKNLVKVNLSRTRVTNKGLRFLRHTSIVQLSLDGSGVTLQGVSDLMSVCPTITSVRASNLRVIPTEQVSEEEGGS